MKKIGDYVRAAVYLGLLIVAFAGIDYFIHALRPEWAVPEYYFRNKLIFGWLWSLVAWLLAERFSGLWTKSLIFSALVAVVLQARYYWEGYPLDFVLIFLAIHWLIIFGLALIMFSQFNKRKKI